MAINITDIEGGDVQIVELYTGPRGESSEIFTGTAPPDNSVGSNNDVYVVDSGSAGIGDVYKKTTGEWSIRGNIRGPMGTTTAHVHPVTDVTGLQAALNAKEPTIASGTTSQYFRGDKTWQGLTKAAVGLENVDNTSDLLKPISTPTQTALNTKVSLTGNESIAGVKTFSTAPVVPNNSFTMSKITNLQTELDFKTAYVQAKGQDLIVNGFGTMGNNTNFSQFTYTAADAPTGAAGSFISGAFAGTFTLNELLPVDPARKLKFSFQIRQTGTQGEGRFYGLIMPMDAFKSQIGPQHYMYTAGTLTTLAAPLNPGDTTIVLTSSANWYGQAGKPAGGANHLRNIIWWDYVDPGGKAWPELTYSRNTLSNPYDDGSLVGNTITLRAPYTGPAKPAGTKLSNGSSGGSYMYTSPNNVIASAEWTAYSGTVVGLASNGGNASFATGWPHGTAYATVGWLLNRNTAGGTAVGSRHAVAAVSLSDATAAQDMATEALNFANTRSASTHGHALTDASITGTLPLAQLPTHTHTKAQITDLDTGIWVNVTQAPYLADKTGAADARSQIQLAIDAVAAAGGGTVFLPAGAYRIGYVANGGGTGAAGGLQLKDSVTIRGEGTATRLFASGTWATQAGIIAIGDTTTTRAVRDAAVRELWIKGTAGTSHSTAQNNINAVLFNTSGITTEPDAAHRLLDLTIWDCDRGITIYGVDDRAVLGQRIRLRHFLRQAILIGKENNSGGGADGYWSDIDASSGNRIAGGTYATIEIRSSNVHMVNSKSWYTKRETAFVNSGDYIDGAGFALLAPRTTMIGCEAQDNGGHGFVVRVGQQTLTGCVADSNNRSDCISVNALPYECSGFYIGSSASNVTLTGANSFDKRTDLAERFQKYGFALAGSARNVEIRGIAKDNRSSSSAATAQDGMAWVSGTPHESHSVFVQAMYANERATITNAGGGTNSAFIPIIDTRTSVQPARRIELDFPLATSNPNLEEVRDERDEIVSWRNEAGQYRFRNPYATWADSGVRGIIEAGDYVGTANAGGNFMELVNRNLPDTPARKLWGVRWETGKTVRNGVEMPDLFVRQSASDPIPATTPANSVVVTLDGEKVVDGLIIHGWSGGTAPVVNGTVTVDSTSIINPQSLKITNDSTAAHARFEFGANQKVVVRFYIKTPASWPANAVPIAGFRPTTSSLAASINLTGTSSPGRLRLIATGGATVAESPQNTLLPNSNYRIELRYDASRTMASLSVYELGEDVAKWSSGMVMNPAYNLAIIRADLGRLNTTPAVPDFYLDGISVVTNSFGVIGRHADDTLSPTAVPKPPYAGPVAFWDGTTLWPLINH